MAKCFICKKDLTNPAHAQRGYGDDCAKTYQRYLAAFGTSEAELAELESKQDEQVTRWVRNFQNSLSKSKHYWEPALKAARRAAGRIEAEALGLNGHEFFDYVDRRAQGDSAAELKAEIDEANRAIELERQRYLAEGADKIVYALMERMNYEVTMITGKNFIAGHSTDSRHVATGLQTALVTAIAYVDTSTNDLIAFANRQGWFTASRFIERNETWIHQERMFRQGIERRLRADAPMELKLAA